MASRDLVATLEHAGVPVGEVVDIAAVLDGTSAADRQMVVAFQRDDAGTVRAANTPWKFDGMAPAATRPAPRLGQHNEELFVSPTHDERESP